ncbi:MAG: peptidylprolyl isomerase [Candidatus Sumerlaeaceae bacterium]
MSKWTGIAVTASKHVSSLVFGAMVSLMAVPSISGAAESKTSPPKRPTKRAESVLAEKAGTTTAAASRTPSLPDKPLPDTGKPGQFLLAVVKGKELREDTFTTYCSLVDYLEGGGASEKRQHDLLQDFVLQEIIDDVIPDIARKVTKPEVPFPYTTFQELAILKQGLRMKLENETSPTKAEMDVWTRENANRFARPEQVHAFHLFMQISKDVPTSSAEAVRQRMAEVKKLADEGTSFAQLARKYSEAASGKTGGDIGWISRRMPIGPEAKPMNIVLENALFNLKPGQVSDILETSHGLHLMYCADRLTTYVPTTDELITSRILPRSLQLQMVRQKWQDGVKAMKEKLGAKVLFDVTKADSLTSDVPAVKIKDRTWSLRQLEEVYGPRFTAAYRARSQSTETLAMLFDEVVNELAAIHWALEEGVDKDPRVARDLEWASKRAHMKKVFAAYTAESFPVTEELIKKTYEQRKDLMRLPEGRGYIISINAKPTSAGMSLDEARQAAKRKAEEIRKRILAGENIEKLARELSEDNRASSGGLVERSVLAHLNDPAGRMFGAVASWLKAGELSEVRQFGNTFVIVKLEERWEGEVPPYEQVRERLRTSLQSENEHAARRDVLIKGKNKKLVRWANPAAKYGVNPAEGY